VLLNRRVPGRESVISVLEAQKTVQEDASRSLDRLGAHARGAQIMTIFLGSCDYRIEGAFDRAHHIERRTVLSSRYFILP